MVGMASETANRARPATTLQVSAKQFVPSVLLASIAPESRFLLQLEIAPQAHFQQVEHQPLIAQAAILAPLNLLVDFALQAGSQPAVPRAPIA